MLLVHVPLIIQIQVAHLQPDTITLVGEGVFPCIGFDLPNRLMEPSCTEYGNLREMAEKNLISREKSMAGKAMERYTTSVSNSDLSICVSTNTCEILAVHNLYSLSH